MATTTTKKKATTTKKATPAKKATPVKNTVPVKKAEVETPVTPVAPVAPAEPIATEPKRDEFIIFVIPKDPALGDGRQYWEHDINGTAYRIERGIPQKLTPQIVETILNKMKLQARADARIEAFKNGQGVRLN